MLSTSRAVKNIIVLLFFLKITFEFHKKLTLRETLGKKNVNANVISKTINVTYVHLLLRYRRKTRGLVRLQCPRSLYLKGG